MPIIWPTVHMVRFDPFLSHLKVASGKVAAVSWCGILPPLQPTKSVWVIGAVADRGPA